MAQHFQPAALVRHEGVSHECLHTSTLTQKLSQNGGDCKCQRDVRN